MGLEFLLHSKTRPDTSRLASCDVPDVVKEPPEPGPPRLPGVCCRAGAAAITAGRDRCLHNDWVPKQWAIGQVGTGILSLTLTYGCPHVCVTLFVCPRTSTSSILWQFPSAELGERVAAPEGPSLSVPQLRLGRFDTPGWPSFIVADLVGNMGATPAASDVTKNAHSTLVASFLGIS